MLLVLSSPSSLCLCFSCSSKKKENQRKKRREKRRSSFKIARSSFLFRFLSRSLLRFFFCTQGKVWGLHSLAICVWGLDSLEICAWGLSLAVCVWRPEVEERKRDGRWGSWRVCQSAERRWQERIRNTWKGLKKRSRVWMSGLKSEKTCNSCIVSALLGFSVRPAGC